MPILMLALLALGAFGAIGCLLSAAVLFESRNHKETPLENAVSRLKPTA